MKLTFFRITGENVFSGCGSDLSSVTAAVIMKNKKALPQAGKILAKEKILSI